MLERVNLPQFYKNDIRPKLEKFEMKRVKVRKALVLTILLFGLTIFSLYWYFEVRTMTEISIVAAISFGVLTFLKGKEFFKLNKSYYVLFKKEIIQNIIHLILPDCNYSHKNRISNEIYHDSKLFTKGVDKWKGDDHVSGQIDKTSFQFSELHTQYKTTTTDSKGRRKTSWHTIFKGIFFVADFNKNIKSETFVLPDMAESIFGNWIGKKLQDMSSTFHSKGDLVKLENPEFEKKFVVYSGDQQEARYILTPKMMEKIVNIKNKSEGNLHLSFKGNKIFVAISHSRDLFEPSIWSNSLKYKDVKNIYNTLNSIFSLIHEFELNLRIWTKE